MSSGVPIQGKEIRKPTTPFHPKNTIIPTTYFTFKNLLFFTKII
jgi:hypothetical protein